jgi:hypothetical protein
MRSRICTYASNPLVHEKATPTPEIMTGSGAFDEIRIVNLPVHHSYCEVALNFLLVIWSVP